MATDYLLDSQGNKVATYDLHRIYYPESVYQPNGTQMPHTQALKEFKELRSLMKYTVRNLAQAVHQEEHLLVLEYRELEHARLDVIGATPDRIYIAQLTRPSRSHPMGRIRSDIYHNYGDAPIQQEGN